MQCRSKQTSVYNESHSTKQFFKRRLCKHSFIVDRYPFMLLIEPLSCRIHRKCPRDMGYMNRTPFSRH
ncbi:hypothetical protein MKW98_022388 [Papaver atlanticum]|uniref:Uncharacterized protein n=1 Tax=Papaver atlanticum TaxID=357466 RepID=A0AAD4SMX9_9MAGN|nr:hypothetical protein MKW98_022388 [Papaver atlanticum]